MHMKFWLAIAALAAPVSAAWAASDVTLASEVFVERTKAGPEGKPVVVRETPTVVTPGDKLIFELSYRNQGAQPATGFALTDPIPASVVFAGGESPDAVFSVDGGKTWGPLASLKVAQPDGTSRPAVRSDVTHIRWTFSRAIPAGTSGKLSFRGVVK
jgi:uncharacterized repeat protein (TIGR01451 family)